MRQMKRIFLFFLVLFFGVSHALQATWPPWGEPDLLTIGEQNYSTEDFESWWDNYREKGMLLPETPSLFIDWMLLSDEAQRMRLFEAPGYRNKVLTFLKARALMQLKSEEIDSKIDLSEDQLWKQYLKTYAPRSHIHVFLFSDQEKAQIFSDRLNKEKPENFASSYGEKDQYLSQRLSWYRPSAIHETWQQILVNMDIGELSQPFAWKNSFVVLRLLEVKAGSKDDFAHVKHKLRESLWKKEEGKLTANLVKTLRKKYDVSVNEELFDQLDPDGESHNTVEESLIFTNNGNISEQLVLAKMRQVINFRRQNGFKVETNEAFKLQVVNGIIDQTIISWEALDRKYEERPPFEKVYRFYCQNRLQKELDQKLFAPQITLGDEEIKTFFQDNIERYTTPAMVKLVIVEGKEEELKKMWLDVTLGGDFQNLGRELTGHKVEPRTLPVNHLNPKVKQVLDKLSKDEVSHIFTVDGHVSLVKLIERKPAQVMKLTEVKESIRDALQKEKLDTLRQEYLARLKAEYPVTIDDSVWQNLRKELEPRDETN